MDRSPVAETFRPGQPLRFLFGVGAVVFGGFGWFALIAPFIGALAQEDDTFVDIAAPAWLMAAMCAVAAAFFLSSFRAEISASAEGVTWRNYFFKRGELSWPEVERFYVGNAYFGIHVVTRRRQTFTLHAIQKSNAKTWLGSRARADDVVDQLNAFHQRFDPRSDLPPRPDVYP